LIGGKMSDRPKRRKISDNPYTLQVINNTYVVIFKDNTYKNHIVEVSEDVFNAMNSFELDDLKELNEFDRHIEHSLLLDEKLYIRAKNKPLDLEDEIIRKSSFEDLKKAINTLPEIQKRRIKKYYFEEKNEYEIAKEENTTQQAINKNLHQAIKKLKEILKK
jgi:RNA polymerase sigma-70 factor (ECF subfamily)